MVVQFQRRFEKWSPQDAQTGAERAAELFAIRAPTQKAPNGFKCSMCYHPRRVEMDTAILTLSMAYSSIGPRYMGKPYARQQVQVHRDKHVLPLLGAPTPTAMGEHLMVPISGNAGIDRKLEWYRLQFLALRQGYMERTPEGTWIANPVVMDKIVKLLVEARNCDVLLTKFREGDGAKVVNGVDSEKWERIKGRLAAAAENHPEARAWLLEALEEGE